jgi:hypothetical protein
VNGVRCNATRHTRRISTPKNAVPGKNGGTNGIWRSARHSPYDNNSPSTTECSSGSTSSNISDTFDDVQAVRAKIRKARASEQCTTGAKRPPADQRQILHGGGSVVATIRQRNVGDKQVGDGEAGRVSYSSGVQDGKTTRALTRPGSAVDLSQVGGCFGGVRVAHDRGVHTETEGHDRCVRGGTQHLPRLHGFGVDARIGTSQVVVGAGDGLGCLRCNWSGRH